MNVLLLTLSYPPKILLEVLKELVIGLLIPRKFSGITDPLFFQGFAKVLTFLKADHCVWDNVKWDDSIFPSNSFI